MGKSYSELVGDVSISEYKVYSQVFDQSDTDYYKYVNDYNKNYINKYISDNNYNNNYNNKQEIKLKKRTLEDF